MAKDWEYICCPDCGIDILVKHGVIQRHERGMRYVPYRMYRAIEKITGTPVKELARRNLCVASGRKYHVKKDREPEKETGE